MQEVYFYGISTVTLATAFICWLLLKKSKSSYESTISLYKSTIDELEANQIPHIETIDDTSENYPHDEINAETDLSEKYSDIVYSQKEEKFIEIANSNDIDPTRLNQFPLSQLNEMFESTPIPDGEAELLHTQIGAIFEEEYASYNSEKAFELLSLEVVKNLVFSSMNRSLFDIDSDVIGDANDEGIDSYIIQGDPMGTNYGLTLVQSKWHETVANNKLVKDNHEPLDKLCATAMRIWKGSDPVGNDQVQKLFVKWRELGLSHDEKVKEYAWNEPPLPSIYLVLVCNEYTDNEDNNVVRDSLEATVLNLQDVKILHENRVSDPVPTKKEIINATLVPVYESDDGTRRDFVGAISADEFCRLYNKNKDKDKKKTRNAGFLFGNVRNRLSSNKKNATALEILRKVSRTINDEPEEFFSRNNGMTIVVHKLSKIKDTQQYLLESPQLVNGGQTANALWDAYTKGENEQQRATILQRLKKISILVKIVEVRNVSAVEHMDIMAKVASSSNHQNPVVNRDLHSVLRPMRELKQLVENCLIFYETKQGDWAQLKSIQPDAARTYKLSNGVEAFLDNDVVATNLWVIFGGGAIANAKNALKWDEDSLRKILFYETPLGGVINQKYSLIYEEQRWNLTEERVDYVPEIVYSEFLHQEIAENLMKKAKGKTTALNRLNIDPDLKIKLGILRMTINGWSNIALAFDQAMRIRCGTEKRNEYLKFFIGDPVGNRNSAETKALLKHIFQKGASYVQSEFEKIQYDEDKVTISYFNSKSLHEEYENHHKDEPMKWSFLKMLDLTLNIMIDSYTNLINNDDDYTGSPGERRKKHFFQDIVQRLENSQELQYIALNDNLKNSTLIEWESNVSDLWTNCNDIWGNLP